MAGADGDRVHALRLRRRRLGRLGGDQARAAGLAALFRRFGPVRPDPHRPRRLDLAGRDPGPAHHLAVDNWGEFLLALEKAPEEGGRTVDGLAVRPVRPPVAGVAPSGSSLGPWPAFC